MILAHFVTGTQVALNLALNYPDKIGRVIIIGGSPYRFYPSQKKDGTWSDWENEKQYTPEQRGRDRKSTRLNSSHGYISYAVFCLQKKNADIQPSASPIA